MAFVVLQAVPLGKLYSFEALSVGIEPKGLNPLAVEVMPEIGINISQQRSKDMREFLGSPIPYIITVCDNARKYCRIFPGTFTYMYWSIEDPAAVQGTEEKLAVFRRIRDQIGSRVKGFVYEKKRVFA